MKENATASESAITLLILREGETSDHVSPVLTLPCHFHPRERCVPDIMRTIVRHVKDRLFSKEPLRYGVPITILLGLPVRTSQAGAVLFADMALQRSPIPLLIWNDKYGSMLKWEVMVSQRYNFSTKALEMHLAQKNFFGPLIALYEANPCID